MGNYKVFYFDGLEDRHFIGCEVCKRLNRNVIEPIAVILNKKNYLFNKNFNTLKYIENLEDLKSSDIFEKILNKDDLTCIFHQKKKGKHWEEDTEEFRKWNVEVFNLAGKLFDKEFNSLDKDNLLNQFWKRIRAYRFTVDYKEDWQNSNNDWNNFLNTIKTKEFPPDIEGIESNKELIEFYLKNLNKDKVYDFRFFIFPLFFQYFQFFPFKSFFLENMNNFEVKCIYNFLYELKSSFNFWYKSELLKFGNAADFDGVVFSNETYFFAVIFSRAVHFIRTTFSNEANLWGVKFCSIVNFEETKFSDKADFSSVIFTNNANFSKVVFSNIAYFGSVKFSNIAKFSEATFNSMVSFFRATFSSGASFFEATFNSVVSFIRAKFEGRTYFRDCYINSLNLEAINLTEKSYFEIKDANFHKLNLKDFINYTDSFLISNVKLLKLYEFFCEYNRKFFKNTSSIKINKMLNYYNKLLKNTKFEKNNFKNRTLNVKLTNYKNLYHEYLYKKPLLTINNCILNKMKFINCDFSKAKIDIEDSYLEEVIFSNVDWGNVSEERICKELFDKKPQKAQDIYRQIKLSLDKQANYIDGNKFYALEMRAVERYLKNKPWKDYFQEKLVFILFKFISNFGQSWIKPFILIISLTFIILGFGAIDSNKQVIIPFEDKTFWLIFIYSSFLLPLIYILFVEFRKKIIVNFREKIIYIVLSAFPLTIFIYLIFIKDFSISQILDNFVMKLNIANVLKLNAVYTENTYKLSGYLAFAHFIYALSILVLIYHLILAIRRRVKR